MKFTNTILKLNMNTEKVKGISIDYRWEIVDRIGFELIFLKEKIFKIQDMQNM